MGTFESTEVRGFFHPADHIVPRDIETGGVQPPIIVNAIVGFSPFAFDFFNEGGRNNLLPGRPTTQTASFQGPSGAGAFVVLRSFLGAFVTDGGVNLTERPLGEFDVSVGFANNTTLSCTIRLSDSNGDDPIKVSVRGFIVFFR
jgi:hypothetical protein